MKQSISEFVIFFGVSFVPTVAVCLFCYGLNIKSFCDQVAEATNTTCSLFWGIR